MQIKVIDSLMGSGKTSWAIARMRKEPGPWLYISPYLTEVDRVLEACSERDFIQPLPSNDTTKSDDLCQLLAEGRNIAATHSLFSRIKGKAVKAIQQSGYSLIIDEMIEVVRPIPIKAEDIDALVNAGALVTEQDGPTMRVLLGPNSGLDRLMVGTYGTVAEVRSLAATGNLIQVGESMLLWILSDKALRPFKEVFNLTFMFDGSLSQAFYQAKGFGCERAAVEQAGDSCQACHSYHLVDYNPEHELAQRERIRSLINIVEGSLNEVGDKKHSLSYGWWHKRRKSREQAVRSKLCTFYRHHMMEGTTAQHNMWASFKANTDGLRGNGFTNAWVPYNLRATNLHRDKVNLAYVVNRYLNPYVKAIFDAYEVELSEDIYALSCLLQWAFRSAIRDGKPITLYLPSARMRSLLRQWLDGVPLDSINGDHVRMSFQKWRLPN